MDISMYMCCMKFRDEIFIRWVDCNNPSRFFRVINYEKTELPYEDLLYVCMCVNCGPIIGGPQLWVPIEIFWLVVAEN